MRKKKLLNTLISIITAMVLIFLVSFTVFATDVVVETYAPEEPQVTEYYEPEPETEPVPEYIETEPYVEETEPVEQGEVEETKSNDNNNNILDELPQVESYEVVIPTTVKLPDIEVSDTSLMGGVIAWLCVALGIAVIAGVLVSQRTRQVGSNNSQSTRRR